MFRFKSDNQLIGLYLNNRKNTITGITSQRLAIDVLSNQYLLNFDCPFVAFLMLNFL